MFHGLCRAWTPKFRRCIQRDVKGRARGTRMNVEVGTMDADVELKGYSRVRCKVQNTWTGELSM